MQLRDYQVDAINRVRVAMRQGARRVALVMPTGSGKTRTCGEIVRSTVASGRRALWLAHRAELIDQAADTLVAYGLTVGAMCSTARTPPNPFAPVQVASVQTLLARNERPRADVIIFDEAHHASLAAEYWSSLFRDYPNALVIGPTATPERGDGAGLSGCFAAIVVGATVAELTIAGHLVPCEIMRPTRALDPGQIALHPVDAYMADAPGRRAILFARSVSLANEYANAFNARGITARSVSAETPWAERSMTIEAFRKGRISVLTSVAVLTEGFDAPETDCVILARGCGSAGLYLQMIGRALRPAPGKQNAIILDLRGVSHVHGLPTDERAFSLEGRGIRLKDKNSYCAICQAPKQVGEACDVCGPSAGPDESQRADKITGEKLVKYAAKRAETPEQRAMTLSRWLLDARKRGFKDGWAYAKFSAVYGCRPDVNTVSEARNMMRGAA